MNAVLAERTVAGLHDSLAGRVERLLPCGAPVLDVGCGTGAWLQRLRERGFTNLHGTDLDIAQFALADVAVSANDLNDERWRLAAPRFRLITAIEVIEHLQNIENFFRNLYRHLDDCGLCLLTTPNIHSLHARLRYLLTADMKQFGRIGDPTHVFPVLGATLERLCARHGFEIAEQWGYPSSGDCVGARRWVNASVRVLRRVLPEPICGDVYCTLLRKR
jgi:2-polyprenyl-3-methyl-5-hydroxy-6-metoxy-1,4-benzoquinol methylase